jgi:hypothetical protein
MGIYELQLRARPHKRSTHLHNPQSCLYSEQNHRLWICSCFLLYPHFCTMYKTYQNLILLLLFPNSTSCHFWPLNFFQLSSLTTPARVTCQDVRIRQMVIAKNRSNVQNQESSSPCLQLRSSFQVKSCLDTWQTQNPFPNNRKPQWAFREQI